MFKAFQSCFELDIDQDTKIRNFSCLMQEIPWYNKSLLLKMLPLMASCISPGNSASNGLSLVSISLVAAPFLLRSPEAPLLAGHGLSSSESDRLIITTAATASAVTAFLIQHQATILSELRLELVQIQNRLNAKIDRIKCLLEEMTMVEFRLDLREMCEVRLDGGEEGEEKGGSKAEANQRLSMQLAKALWKALEMTETLRAVAVRHLSFSSSSSSGDDGDNDDDKSSDNCVLEEEREGREEVGFGRIEQRALMEHTRWALCGFAPLTQELATGGTSSCAANGGIDFTQRSRKTSIVSGLLNMDEANDKYPLQAFEAYPG